jgi:hypothetical protein
MPERTRQPLVTTVKVDLTGVTERKGGRAAHVPEGDYLLKLKRATKAQNNNKDGYHIRWEFNIIKGPGRSRDTVYHRTSLKPDALWNLANLLTALRGGKEVPKQSLSLDLTKFFGKDVGATLIDGEPYNDRIKSEVSDFFPASEYDEEAALAGYEEGEEAEGEEVDEDETEPELEPIDEDI